ncbi:MAG: leucyl aminopeptidase [Chloroflexota bacterium]|jgi:leucyl aminopeptidase|nr:leucyl aminopeptidase [Chloroflexota bacterium]
MVRILVEGHDRLSFSTPMLVMNAFEDGGDPPDLQRADDALAGTIRRLRDAGEISGKPNSVTVIHTPALTGNAGALGAARLAFVGRGKLADISLEGARQTAATAALKARELRLTRFAMTPMGVRSAGLDPVDVGRALAEGIVLALYRYDRFKTERNGEQPPEVEEVTILPINPELVDALRKGVDEGTQLAEATITARDLATGPGNVVTATHLGERAAELARQHGFAAQIFGKSDLEEMGCGGILAVNSGSAEPPVMGVLRYDCGNPNAKTLAVVGKGITFDTGGISIKPANNMHYMRHDKSGASAVIGFMQAASALKLPINVLGVFGATDNMPSGSAYRPGDVIRSYAGTYMEIMNTDAEGRVVLADCLAYAAEQKPDAIVDLATLTGACVVALGHVCSGLFSNDDDLSNALTAAGESSGERLWRMPLWQEYREQIKAPLGDIQNVGGSPAGAITAAWFLANFVGETPWAHLDIAGTAWTEGSWAVTPPYLQRDLGTGVGVRLLSYFARSWA